ncbi:MAG TPA: alkaline phosphatase family protein, partial [Flavipsychrobacter sp.]|nr:alkaline phosphatase family protein [Flavipsychrobacter sp.]
MKNLSFGISLLFLVFIGKAQTTSTLPRPKLVVGIVVDQMRWDYLYRYYDRYDKGGFKRLLHQGFSCENTMINYSPSYTAPGHAGIYTGSVPSVHGIAGNDWIDNQTGRHWYCVEDTNVVSIGGSKASGMMSPNNLLTTTITDELRLATNFKSKVVGISLKDRGSILPAGHLGKAYWLDDSTGNLITSSYYSNELPEWVNQLNKRQLINTYLNNPWTTLYPIATYTQSLPDNNPYESSNKKE